MVSKQKLTLSIPYLLDWNVEFVHDTAACNTVPIATRKQNKIYGAISSQSETGNFV